MTSPSSKSPAVTVVMPVFNGEKFLRESLDSIFGQTFTDYEVIVVDDGSTDGTLALLQEYGDRIQILRQQKQGHPTARNTAIQVARAPWIAMLDADDIWEPNAMQEMMALTKDAAVVYSARSNFEDSQRVDDVNFADGQLPQGDVFEDLIMDNFITHSGVLLNRDVLIAEGCYNATLKTTCDWDLWLRLSARGHRFAGCPLPLVRYRWRATSHSKNHQQTAIDRAAVLTAALDSERGQQVKLSQRRKALSCVWATSAWFVAETDDRMALKWYLRSARYQPSSLHTWKQVTRCCLHLVGLSR